MTPRSSASKPFDKSSSSTPAENFCRWFAARSQLSKGAQSPLETTTFNRILGGPFGDVNDLHATPPYGRSDIDAEVSAFAKAPWKFLSAVTGDSAVPFRTTVLIPLAGA